MRLETTEVRSLSLEQLVIVTPRESQLLLSVLWPARIVPARCFPFFARLGTIPDPLRTCFSRPLSD